MTRNWPAAGVAARVGLYGRTLRSLGFGQLAWRVRRRLARAAPRQLQGEIRAGVGAFWQRPVPHAGGWLSPLRWSCHGGAWELAANRPWAPPGIPDLDLYQLHYLDDLSSAAALANPTGHQWLLRRWLAENTTDPASAWDPYPVSRRLVNICKWLLAGGEASPELAGSLASHADLLLRGPEYDLRGNHLLANAVALVFAGRMLSGALAERSGARGAALLEQTLRKQVLPDGGHYERSPMYHAIVLEDLLDLRNLLGAGGGALANRIGAVLPAMLAWLQCMTLPDRRIAFFNDAAFDGCRATGDLLEYAARLGVLPAEPPAAGALALLPHSGFARLRAGRMTMVADVGSAGPAEQPGHVHAGTLSFELAVDAERVLVNTGTSTYERGPLRAAQRATRAHNTVEIDGTDSSEVWASFRVGRRAQVRGVRAQHAGAAGAVTELSAAHDGYAWLAGRPVHERRWRVAVDAIEIVDRIASQRPHELAARLHLHPDCAATLAGDAEVVVRDREGRRVLTITRSGWTSVAAESYRYAPAFGQLQDATVLVFRARSENATNLTMVVRS